MKPLAVLLIRMNDFFLSVPHCQPVLCSVATCRGLFYSCMYLICSFIHASIPRLFLEGPVCPLHCMGRWGCNGEQKVDLVPVLRELIVFRKRWAKGRSETHKAITAAVIRSKKIDNFSLSPSPSLSCNLLNIHHSLLLSGEGSSINQL